MSNKLETRIMDNGKAFSIAERQLFCIARAILLDSSVLIFDGLKICLMLVEPPVAVDNETDKLIMQTIRENFETKTVIILASRFANSLTKFIIKIPFDHASRPTSRYE
jgi:ABC-type multidrug transport system fused ATPase/permease subunit